MGENKNGINDMGFYKNNIHVKQTEGQTSRRHNLERIKTFSGGIKKWIK